ncbi:restriction endonuclease subunit S [Streptomyces massasporeus]
MTSDGFRPSENKLVTVRTLVDPRYEIHSGDLLFSRANTPELVGAACLVTDFPQRLMLSDKTLRLVLKPDLADARFVNLCLSSPAVRKQIELASSGSSRSMQNISQRSLEQLTIPWPPLGVQRRIVETLDGVNESERTLGEAIAKLRFVRRGVVLNGMAAIGAAAAPQGWQRIPLKDVVPSVEYGISVALNGDTSETPTLRMNNLRDGRPDLRELRYAPNGVDSRLLLQPGDVLFNRTNSIEHVGRAGIWGGELRKATFASYLVRLNPDVRRLDPRYLVEWLQHPVIRQRVRSIATVAVQQVNVNPSRLRELEIDLPVDLSDQAKLISALDDCDQRIAAEIESLEKIRTMKQGLAARLLGGKPAPAAA